MYFEATVSIPPNSLLARPFSFLQVCKLPSRSRGGLHGAFFIYEDVLMCQVGVDERVQGSFQVVLPLVSHHCVTTPCNASWSFAWW